MGRSGRRRFLEDRGSGEREEAFGSKDPLRKLEKQMSRGTLDLRPPFLPSGLEDIFVSRPTTLLHRFPRFVKKREVVCLYFCGFNPDRSAEAHDAIPFPSVLGRFFVALHSEEFPGIQ